MMILSRLWYVVLALLLGIATYVVYLAVGEYDRRNVVAMQEELASDSQTVGWALQIDARKRLDALLIGAVDKGVQDALLAATGKDSVPNKAKEDGRRALNGIHEKIPADFKPDAIFAVDHDGRVVSQVGFDSANTFTDFELGGYPAVFDALHGYLRDDTWVLGGKPYRVAARPVEFDSTQPPLGAIVAIKAVDDKFAGEISKRTRANVAFFAGGLRIAKATVTGFDAAQLTKLDSDLSSVATDKAFQEGRSDVRLLGDDLGVVYARFLGDAWELGAGFAVVRTRAVIGGPLGFLNGADDKDKASVNLGLIAAVVLVGIALGILLSFLEHTLPEREMVRQAAGLKKGAMDYLQIARFRGAFRGIAQDVNAGIERVLEKGGGAARKPADLESILGPVPAQPAMSAFSFPLPDANSPPQRPSAPFVPPHAPPGPPPPTSTQQMGPPAPRGPGAAPATTPLVAAVGLLEQPKTIPLQGRAGPAAFPPVPTSPTTTPRASSPAFPPAGPPIPPPIGASPGRPAFQVAAEDNGPDSVDGDGPTMASSSPLQMGGAGMPSPLGGPTVTSGPPAGMKPRGDGVNLGMAAGRPEAVGKQTMMGIGLQAQAAARAGIVEEEEATVIGRAPSEVLAEASGHNKAVNDETAEWTSVYDEFLRTKKQCGEPTDGLTFEKFQNTLKKNRDALVERHHCKRVRFSVYVKDGRASLKATPVKE